MILFGDSNSEISPSRPINTDCDIFDPSVYEPDNSKYRANYLKSITARIGNISVDDTHLSDGGQPQVEARVTGSDLIKNIEFVFRNLLGPVGPQGDAAIDRLSLIEFNRRKEEGTILGTKWYFVSSNTDALLYIYAGETLVAKSDSIGNIFPITFPLIFSN